MIPARGCLFLLMVALLTATVSGGKIHLVKRAPDPYGSPRPAHQATQVPLRSSLYLELALRESEPADRILPDSVILDLKAESSPTMHLLMPNRKFVDGARGWVRPRTNDRGGLSVYVDPGVTLQPSTTYRVEVAARSREGAVLAKQGTWSFTTGAGAREHAVQFTLDLGLKPLCWHGGFFTGICNVVFCTKEDVFGPMYRRMSDTHKEHPRAWRYQRDIWMTATDDRKPEWHLFMDPHVPNLVRERETRRITAIENREGGVLLRLDDFYGHQQYGVASDRPLSEDYKPGYEILIADGVSDARSKVLAVDDDAKSILIASIPATEPAWHLEYQATPPKEPDPDAPGLFAAGGTHLRRFEPPGTPVYYWGRLDKEYDLACETYGRRLAINFVEAPSDLSLTGRPYTRPKDYAVWHEVVRTITAHLIDRYGEATMDFAWSTFNEPDLVGDYWRFHWDEVQRFHDYTVDGVLWAFEDRGYDSRRVRVGGLELGAIFGTNLRLKEFLAHCSPRAEAQGALSGNAAFADRRLDGKRSRRVEELCREHQGKGSPCDFISVHTYNRSAMAAAKLIRAKEMALETDSEFYRDLWINSHESCPNWSPPPDQAAADSYLGNGYFATWCLDVVHRQLQKAAVDPRYAFGETVVTIWPPPQGFSGVNALGRRLPVDEDGDGMSDRMLHVPAPIFHALTLLSGFGPNYWTLPEQQVGGHRVGGFASQGTGGTLRVALFSHAAEDAQSRSEDTFSLALHVTGLNGDGPIRATEYRFDRKHNTYFAEAVVLRDGPAAADPEEIESLTRILEIGDPAAVRHAFERIRKLDPVGLAAIGPAFLEMAANLTDDDLRRECQAHMQGLFGSGAASPPGYRPEKMEAIRKLSELRVTDVTSLKRGENGTVTMKVRAAGNGASFLVIEPTELAGRARGEP